MLAAVFYSTMFIASLVFTIIYTAMWHKHFDVHFTLMYSFIPITNFGYVVLSQAQTPEVAIIGKQITYIGGTYLILFIMLSVLSLCRVRLAKGVRTLFYILSTVEFLCVLTIGKSPLFYKSITFVREKGVVIIEKEYGVMHHIFILTVVAYFALSFLSMLYAYFFKKDVSRKTLRLVFFPELIAVMSFFGGRWLDEGLEILPLSYVLAQVFYLFVIHRIPLYDISETSVDSLVQTGDTGFVSFDFKDRYLGSNETARNIFPALRELKADRTIKKNKLMRETALRWLEDFKADETKDKVYYKSDGRVYLVDINYLYNGSKKRGYQFFITDDTIDQQYISLINGFNSRLQDEVEKKTRHIEEMHDNLILSMATMVESRDNSTGGHIRRTSDVVRILVDEILAKNTLGVSQKFCRNLVKSAPMHDLGKIAVDDAILRKPGRFTPEEFEQMKRHAEEGARIVNEILSGTDNVYFHKIAQNVAHYHHERWDGSGYPKGLKGEEIPLEARIMAVADVYDALVSKRVYKDSMSFAEADSIIMDGFGKHFDERLKPFYVSARPKLEAYYSENAGK